MMVDVTLDLFSGRVNPAWSLSAAEEQEWRRLWEALSIPAAPPSLPALGYRGCVVRHDPGEARVFHGVVTALDATWLDRDRHIERWLLEIGERHLPPDLHSLLRQLRQ